MLFDPVVDAALIGFIGVVVGIGGYALQNWQIKKAERERAEYVIKRERYEKWIKTLVEAWYKRKKTGEPTSFEEVLAVNEANNMLLIYASDDVVNAVVDLWRTDHKKESGKALEQVQKIILAMRKDLVKTNLKEADLEFLKIT